MTTDWFKDAVVSGSNDPGHITLSIPLNVVEKAAGEGDKAFDELKTKIAAQVGRNILETTKSKATGMFNLYANVDLIRPYFNVETTDVARRLVHSLIPRPTSELTGSALDLYGPVVLVLTLVAVMLLGMKLGHRTVQEGTLLGTALVVCSTYWLLSSLFFYFLGYLFSMSITLLGFVSLIGYSLFGTCLSLLIHCFLAGTWIDHAGMLVFGGASALTLGVIFFSHTNNKKNGAVIGVLASSMHFLFLLYLKIYYASFYTALTELAATTF